MDLGDLIVDLGVANQNLKKHEITNLFISNYNSHFHNGVYKCLWAISATPILVMGFIMGSELWSVTGSVLGSVTGSLMAFKLGFVMGSIMGFAIGSVMGSIMGSIVGFYIWEFYKVNCS